MKLLRLSFLLTFCALLQLSAMAHDANYPVMGTVVGNKLVDRAAVEASWGKGLYPYQLADIKRSLSSIASADFSEFAELVGSHLIPITSQDPNQHVGWL